MDSVDLWGVDLQYQTLLTDTSQANAYVMCSFSAEYIESPFTFGILSPAMGIKSRPNKSLYIRTVIRSQPSDANASNLAGASPLLGEYSTYRLASSSKCDPVSDAVSQSCSLLRIGPSENIGEGVRPPRFETKSDGGEMPTRNFVSSPSCTSGVSVAAVDACKPLLEKID